jgi:hypothetical protein
MLLLGSKNFFSAIADAARHTFERLQRDLRHVHVAAGHVIGKRRSFTFVFMKLLTPRANRFMTEPSPFFRESTP